MAMPAVICCIDIPVIQFYVQKSSKIKQDIKEAKAAAAKAAKAAAS